MDEELIDSAIDFLKILRQADKAVIRFEKADGTLRIMKCTLKFDNIPKRDQPKKIDIAQILKLLEKNKIIHVYDLEKKGWRAVPYNKVEWMDADNKRFRVKLK